MSPMTTQGLSLLQHGRRRAKAVAEAVLPRSLVVWRGTAAAGRASSGRVALTFDDGPTSLTRAYLEVLEHFGVRATFFLVGELCAAEPELVEAIARGGHEIAGHGYTHRRFPRLSAPELLDELERTRRLLPMEGHHRPLVRPPHGAVSVASMLTTASAGFTTALWSYDSGDWATDDTKSLVARFTSERVEAGDIVLLHEGQSWTLEALPRIVETLREEGHELVTMGECLAR